MGIWFDDKGESTFPFITSKKRFNNYTVGLIDAPYEPGILHFQQDPPHTFLLAIDGQITNIDDLSNEFLCSLNDANEKLIYAIYIKEGAQGFFKIKGAISFIFVDFSSGTTILYRAFLHGHPLYFTTKNKHLSVSTNAVFLLYRDDINGSVDKKKIANLFATNLLEWTGTVFEEIDEVKSGELVLFTPEGVKRTVQPLEDIFHRNYSYHDEEMAFDHYRKLLEGAVEECIDSKKKYGIMLSSGMDSSSIAYYVAKKMKAQGKKLTAYSWTLPGDSADESENIRILCQELGIELKIMDGQYLGPFDRLNEPFLLPASPFVNFFWPLNQACYKEAHKDGVDYLFNGNYGDLNFPVTGRLLYDIIDDRRFDLLPFSIMELIKKRGLLNLSKALLYKFIGKKQIKEYKGLPWMTDETVLLTTCKKAVLNVAFKSYELALSAFHTGYLSTERYLSGRYSLYRLEPYKNVKLMEYSLGFPSYMTYRGGQKKYFVRKAMESYLPDKIVWQPRVGHLGDFIQKSFERNRETVREKVWKNVSFWNFYVNESWMKEKLQNDAQVTNNDLYIIWLCINLSVWLQEIKPGGSLYEGEFNEK